MIICALLPALPLQAFSQSRSTNQQAQAVSTALTNRTARYIECRQEQLYIVPFEEILTARKAYDDEINRKYTNKWLWERPPQKAFECSSGAYTTAFMEIMPSGICLIPIPSIAGCPLAELESNPTSNCVASMLKSMNPETERIHFIVRGTEPTEFKTVTDMATRLGFEFRTTTVADDILLKYGVTHADPVPQ